MDFPLYHLDILNNRLLIGVIAVLHVVINHPMAVGALALISFLERRGIRSGENGWDDLAYKFLFFCFIITTTVGAMTGVGIWLSASLVNPMSIGSLIRVFFWGWFTEWIVFVLEVTFILVYFLTWKKMSKTPEEKRKHNRIGGILAAWSWITMAIIVAILGFMMDPGSWIERRSLISGVLNPLYLPQLMFRTGFAMITAGLLCVFLTYFFVKKEDPFRFKAIAYVSKWNLAWLPFCGFGAVWYWNRIPESMLGNIPTALTTQSFADWHTTLLYVGMAAVVFILMVSIWGVFEPSIIPRATYLVPFVLAVAMLGYFERVREFIRKPYVIGDYMYANGIRAEDYALLQRDGLLKHATYVKHRTITPENEVEAGEDVFMLACSRCHTTGGLNSVKVKVRNLFGEEWEKDKIVAYLRNMHNARPFMPPFPGNDEELEALTAYLISIKDTDVILPGAQSAGVSIPDEPSKSGLENDDEEQLLSQK